MHTAVSMIWKKFGSEFRKTDATEYDLGLRKIV